MTAWSFLVDKRADGAARAFGGTIAEAARPLAAEVMRAFERQGAATLAPGVWRVSVDGPSFAVARIADAGRAVATLTVARTSDDVVEVRAIEGFGLDLSAPAIEVALSEAAAVVGRDLAKGEVRTVDVALDAA